MSFETQKRLFRERLSQEGGWRRCNRTKKFETYKKTINGQIHRYQFNVYWTTNDVWTEGGGRRGHWQNLEMTRYDSITHASQEEQDTDEYLDRLGIAA